MTGTWDPEHVGTVSYRCDDRALGSPQFDPQGSPHAPAQVTCVGQVEVVPRMACSPVQPGHNRLLNHHRVFVQDPAYIMGDPLVIQRRVIGRLEGGILPAPDHGFMVPGQCLHPCIYNRLVSLGMGLYASGQFRKHCGRRPLNGQIRGETAHGVGAVKGINSCLYDLRCILWLFCAGMPGHVTVHHQYDVRLFKEWVRHKTLVAGMVGREIHIFRKKGNHPHCPCLGQVFQGPDRIRGTTGR